MPVGYPLNLYFRSWNCPQTTLRNRSIQTLLTTLLIITGFTLHGPSSEMEQLIPQLITAVQLRAHSKRNGESTDVSELHHTNTPPNELSSRQHNHSSDKDKKTASCRWRELGAEQYRTEGIDGRLIVIKNGKKEFEGEYIPFIPGEVSYIETADAFGGFGGLTDQMMDNEEPEKTRADPQREEDAEEARQGSRNDRWGRRRMRPGGQTILRGLIGQTVNEEEEQERKEMEELEAQIAAEEERMQEEEAAALCRFPASKKAKKNHDDDADANRMKMAMGGHENRKLTRKGQPDDKKKEEEEERLAREETERLAKLEADRLAKKKQKDLRRKRKRLRKEAVESERKRR
ncbi:hypothetical protein BLNAU_21964 [Blattamonas nauphoetae]|uniref:Uncharacterized protein n=1 Tax=Blattamonas nauphoetae TaxID=2049346 RepID=A0ABQ9WWR0_9EUKA|nr:hypothetical protein BLNAU_21964 [Blattamonas nauphoetae]